MSCCCLCVFPLSVPRYLQLLASQQQPFSFTQDEAEVAAAKAARRAAALDANRFQVGKLLIHNAVVKSRVVNPEP